MTDRGRRGKIEREGERERKREVKIVKAEEQTWRSELRKAAASAEEEEEVMLKRLQTVCWCLLRCVQSVVSLGSSRSQKSFTQRILLCGCKWIL